MATAETTKTLNQVYELIPHFMKLPEKKCGLTMTEKQTFSI
jgi:hypothetical protein